MVRRHVASLVPKHIHDPALLKLMNAPLSKAMVCFIADKTAQAVQCRPPPPLPTPPLDPSSSPSPNDPLPPLDVFIHSIVKKSKCHVPTLLSTVVYLEKLRERLPSTARGCHTTRHRVFLATLIVAAKYLNDPSPLNKHWVRYAVHFTSAETNLMERQLLTLLNFDLRFTEEELIQHLRPLLEPVSAKAGEGSRRVEGYSYAPPSPVYASQVIGPLDSPSKREERPPPVHRPRSRRQDEVLSRRQYGPLAHSTSPPPSSEPSPSQRSTPAYRIPATRGPLGNYTHTPPSSARPADPAIPLSVLSRPPLRPGTSRSSVTSTNSRGSRPPSWSADSTASSPGSSAELARASPRNRTSRLSSHSSTSTLSSTSSGPRTPSPVLPAARESSIPFIPVRGGGVAPPPRAYKQHHRRDPSYAPPSPSLIHALARDVDLWPIMSSSASYAQQDRLVKGEMRLLDAREHELQGRLGLNLRAGERRERVWTMGQ
ncbi:hypothetical protein JCM10213_006784 [Rhodosporidiobolus nylandii]